MAISTGDHWQQHVLQIWWCYYVLTLLDVQQASKPIEVAKDISTMPVNTAQGMSSNEPDLAQKEVATKPLETALCVSSNAPNLVQKKVAIKPAPFLQKTPEPPLPQPPAPQQDERHANGLVEGQQLAPIPLQTSKDADCQEQLDQQLLLQQGDRHANGHVKVSRQVQCENVKLCKTLETFTSDSEVVKVALLTYYEELLIRNRAMCLILCLRHIYFVVFSKTAPLLGLKSIVFRLIYYVISVNRGQIIPLFCSKNAPVISFLVVL